MLQSKLSQTILKHTDYFLSLVEKCIEWSLPEQNIEDEKESGTTELVRPLPWLLFLPCLMILRLIRVTVNIGAFLFNYPKITSSEMITFVQKRRRYLHDAMKNEKYKVTTSKEKLEEKSEVKPKEKSEEKSEEKLEEKSEENPEEKSEENPEEKSEEKPEEKSVAKSIDSTTASKHSMSESAEEKQDEKEKEEREESLTEMINQLGLENSEDDEDFELNESMSDMDNINDDDEDSDIFPNDICDIIKDAKELNKEKMIIEQFLNAERTFMFASNQELVESTCEKIVGQGEPSDKVEEHFATLQHIDSLECCTSDQESDPTFYSPVSFDSDSDTSKDPSVSSAKQCVSRKILKIKEFMNGEARFSASMISDSKSRQTNNNAVVEKHSTNMRVKVKHTNRRKKKIVD